LIDFVVSSNAFPERLTGERDLRAGLKSISERYGSSFVAATMGSEGVLAYYEGQYIHSPAFRIECRDTTGAGDSFHGGFIYGLLTGLSVEETLSFANAVAALKCREVGARTALPTLDEVMTLLKSEQS
jgi:sugar/nucleoside kinase (ribokinase family)